MVLFTVHAEAYSVTRSPGFRVATYRMGMDDRLIPYGLSTYAVLTTVQLIFMEVCVYVPPDVELSTAASIS